MCPEELLAYIATVAGIIAKGKTPEEIGYTAILFSQLGGNLATIAAQKKVLEKNCNPNQSKTTDSAAQKCPANQAGQNTKPNQSSQNGQNDLLDFLDNPSPAVDITVE